MNGKLLAVLRQDIDAFEEKIYEFTNGEIDRKAYKGFSAVLAVMRRGRTDTACFVCACPAGG